MHFWLLATLKTPIYSPVESNVKYATNFVSLISLVFPAITA